MTLKEDYQCSLCDLIMEDPVELLCCQAKQCKPCVMDRTKYSTESICWQKGCGRTLIGFRELPYLGNLITTLKVKRRPKLYCYLCLKYGHRTKKCPTITCIKCHFNGHAEIDCEENVSNDTKTAADVIIIPDNEVICHI